MKIIEKNSAAKDKEYLRVSQPSPATGAIPRRPAGAPVPLSFTQRQLWFLHRVMPANPAYNISTLLRIKGELDIQALNRALNEMVRRHEVLRTRFAESEGEPVQVIEPELAITVGVDDLTGVPSAERECVLEDHLREESRRCFDLEQLPLLRVRILRTGPREQVLLIVMHHIIADGWSLPIFYGELERLYAACLRGEEPPLSELPLQYGDYAIWQRKQFEQGAMQDDLDYWTKQLRGAPEILELPLDYARPEKPKFDGSAESFGLNQDLAAKLKRLGRQAGASFYMTMLAAYAVLLHRYSGQDDILIGMPAANREHSELDGLIGFFANMLVMRVDLSGNPSFMELLIKVRHTALEAYEHQSLPFELLVEKLKPERSLSTNPLFQVLFILMDGESATGATSGSWPRFAPVNNSTFKFDMGLTVYQESSRCLAELGYNSELFRQDTCVRMKGHFQNLLNEIVAHPEASVSTLPMLLPEELEIMRQWRETRTEYPRDKRLEQIFEFHAERTPNATALLYPSVTLTYGELNDAANRIAGHLQEIGVGAETVIGVCMERSWQLIVALLGVLKAGGTYLPLDPGYPMERLQFMLEDTKVFAVLTQPSLLASFPPELRNAYRFVSCEDVVDSPIRLATNYAVPENLAYVMYTSGSTGMPKGIGIPHHAITRLVCNTNYVDLGPDDRLAQASNSSFDAFTFEIWGALLNGGSVVGVTREESLNPGLLAARIQKDRITAMFLTPALFNQFAASEEADAFSELRYLLVGGDALDPKWVREVLKYSAPRYLLNGYGPTENTTFSTSHRVLFVAQGSTSIPIGMPIANTQVYVLDRNMEPVPTGAIGELYVGGDGLARGYVDRPQLTAEKFVPNPFSIHGSERLYRTGDLVRYASDGSIDFVRRNDQQVKIRGFRIEPGEIESVLRKHQQVRESIVLVEENDEEKRLIAYAVTKEGADQEELRQYLKDRLPAFMAPAKLVLLAEWPLTENGKVDRSRLLQHAASGNDQLQANTYVAPRNELEQAIAAIWREVLGVEKIGIYDNIFDLGGHSLLVIRIHAMMRKQLPEETHVKVTDLFLYPTIDSLVQFMGQQQSTAASV